MATASVTNAPSVEVTNAEKMRLLHWNYVRNAANTFFTQFTFFGAAFILFLNELQLNRAQIGLLLSFFPFMGILSFFLAPSVGRFGYKKTWLAFYGSRKIVSLLLLLVPFVAMRAGPQFTLWFVGSIVLLFGICRAISETAIFTWLLEMVPNSFRGRYGAINNIVINIFGIVAVTIASWVLELPIGMNRFTILFAAGSVFGFFSVWASTKHPGGASTQGTDAANISQKDILLSLKDGNYVRFIVGLGLITLGTSPMFSFLPLFMGEQIGLSDGQVVLLQNGTLIGSLSATYLAGWAADRYGSRPVMLTGVWLMVILPIGWLFMPRGTELSLYVALVIAFIQGAGTILWGIGSSRMLYVSIIPHEQKAQYMGSYYALIGLIGGTSQLIGGTLLDLFEGLSGNFGVMVIDSFTPVFVGSLVLMFAALITFRFIRNDSNLATHQFAGMFFHGNPFLAFQSMLRYYRARDEHEMIEVTEKLGQAHSPLNVDELLQALKDPRFFVRFEAVVSIARSDPPDDRYVEALTDILHGTELSLTVLAAWALGRIGDSRAADSLRRGLDSPYRSIRAHCARALGSIGDETIIPELVTRLKTEEDIGLKMAYAAALGSLKTRDGISPIIKLLNEVENEGARMELALSLARIAGDEQKFIQILRQFRQDTATAASQAMFGFGRKFADLRTSREEFDLLIKQAIDSFGQGKINEGIAHLVELIPMLPNDAMTGDVQHIVAECALQISEYGQEHIEYLVLIFDLLGAIEA